jgi:hypothetical protein
MPGQLSPRALAVVVVVLVVLASLALGFEMAFPQSAQRCYAQTLGVEMMTFGNRTYCGESVDLGGSWTSVNNTTGLGRGTVANASFLGFAFSLVPWKAGISGWLNVTIVEPNGTAFHGRLIFGSCNGCVWNTWFTPDNESGVYGPRGLIDDMLLVEVGA